MVEFVAIVVMLAVGQWFLFRLSRRAAEFNERCGRVLLQIRQSAASSPLVMVYPFPLMFMGVVRLMEVPSTPAWGIWFFANLAVGIGLLHTGARFAWTLFRVREVVTASLTEEGVVLNDVNQDGYLFWPWAQIKRWSWTQSPTLQLNLFDGNSVQSLSIAPALRENVDQILRQHVPELTGGDS